jgi:phosphorylcholine metabolism protein LicD
MPVSYDNILNQNYGKYMELPPKEERIARHFY